MAAGSLFQGVCYSTNAQAADAFFLSEGPAFVSGSTSFLSWFEQAGGTWVIVRQSIAANGVVSALPSSVATVPVFPSCDVTETFFDGMAIGWGVAGAMVAAWVIKNLRRGF